MKYIPLWAWPVFLGWSVFAPGRADAQSLCGGSNSNLRLMNVNADCWLSAQDVPDQIIHKYDMDLTTRAQRIASIILREDPDVVTVQEAFDMSCRNAIDAALPSNVWTSRVTYFKANGSAFTSGTMIFSKIPFEAFATPMQGGASDIMGVKGGVAFDESAGFVAWNNYTNFEPSEQGSSLAALMVRVRPRGGCAVNVAFTQSAGAMEISSEQLATMVSTTLGPQINRELTFVLGDLKIDGDGEALPYTFFVNGNPQQANFTEWHRYFDPTITIPPGDFLQTSFFRCGTSGFAGNTTCTFSTNPAMPYLTDAWGFEWPQTDNGHTTGALGQTTLADVADLTPQTGERRDYLLHSQPTLNSTPFLCPQRLKRVFFLDPNPQVSDYDPDFYTSIEEGNVVDFKDQKRVSEHFSLVGDFLFGRFSRCSPMTGVTFGPTVVGASNPDVLISMSLGAAGNRRHYNWVKIDTAGTYSIGASNLTRTNIEVYHHSDLSTPIPAFHGITNQWGNGRFNGSVYELLDPPYFVRYEPSATATLPATFNAHIHRHGCTSPINDFCLLTANVDKTVTWPSGQWVTPFEGPATATPDAMYFVAAVDQASSGAHPRVDFRVEVGNNAQLPTNRMRLFNKCGYVLSAPDCGVGLCNPTLPLTTNGYGNDDGDLQLDVLLETNNHVSGALAPAQTGTPRLVMLRVGRNCSPAASCAATSMSVRYATNFRLVTPVSLHCADEEDPGFNDDEVFIRLTADASAPGSSVCETMPGFTYLGRFDENAETNKQSTSLPGNYGFGAATFVDRVDVTLCESDGSSADNDFLGNVVFDSPNIPPLGETEVLLSEDFDSNPDAEYHFQYRVKTENPNAQAASCP